MYLCYVCASRPVECKRFRSLAQFYMHTVYKIYDMYELLSTIANKNKERISSGDDDEDEEDEEDDDDDIVARLVLFYTVVSFVLLF